MADEQVNILFNFGTDQAKIERLKTDLDALDDKLEIVDRQVQALNDSFGALEDIYTRVGAAGAVIFSPLLLSANKYVETVGKAEAGSRRWLAATEKMQSSQVELGRKATQALVPYLEILSKIVDTVSSVDQGVVNAAVAVGGALALVGAVGLMAAQIGRFRAAVLELQRAVNQLSAQGGAAGAFGGIARFTAGASLIGIGAGIGIGATNLIGTATGDERLKNYGANDAVKTLGQATIAGLATLGTIANGLGTIILELSRQVALGKEDLDDALANLVDSVQLAAIDLVKGIAETEIAGKKIGDVLGIDTSLASPLNLRRQEIQGRLEQRQRLSGLDSYLDPQGNKVLTDRGEINAIFDTALQGIDTVFGEGGAFGQGLLQLAERFNLLNDSAENASDAIQSFTESQLDSFVQFQDDLKAEETSFYADRQQALDEFTEDTKSIEDNWYTQRKQQLDDFNHKQGQAYNDFYANQKKDRDKFVQDQRKKIEEFNKEEIQRLEDFNDEKVKAERDYQRDLENAAARLDAQAVFDLKANYADQEKQRQGDFDKQTQQRRDQLAEQIQSERENFRTLQSERESQFIESQNRQRQEFDHQREQAQVAFDDQQRQRQSQFDKQLADDLRAYEAQRLAKEAAFKKEYYDQLAWQNMELEAREAHYRRLQAQANNYLLGGVPQAAQNIAQGLSGIKAFAEGGYTGRGGLAMTHADEFVLNRNTTSMLERLTGRPLTQNNIQQLARSLSMGNVNMSINTSAVNTEMDFRNIVRSEFLALIENV